MENELDRIRKHNRRIFVALFLLALLVIAGVIITASEKKTPVIQNYVGQPGQAGQPGDTITGPQGPAGYTPVKGLDYSDGAQGPKGDTGVSGPQGTTGATGESGQSIQGPPGDTGPAGKSPEFRCHNGNYQWRYVGDDDWQNLQKNSLACQSAS